MNSLPDRRTIRWWPAVTIFIVAAAAMSGVHGWSSAHFQTRNLLVFVLGALASVCLTIWWIAFSRARWPLRLSVFALVLLSAGAFGAAFRLRGMTGDFLPIFEPRWRHEAIVARPRAESTAALEKSGRPDFPQYLGVHRNCIIDDGTLLARDWEKEPPQILWRQPIGIGWSGFAIVGNRAVTMEQRGENETVTCLDVLTGRELWTHADPVRFTSSFGSDGPRATPTIADGRVFTLGGNGVVNCLALDTGKLLWQRRLSEDAPTGLPEYGYAGSPLVLDGKVIVSAGQSHEKSLFAYRVADGKIAWSGGSEPAGYSSPALATLAGVPQILMFNMVAITAHHPDTGEVLWEYPWGLHLPQVAQPVPVGADRVLFSSGYGVGTELLEIKRDAAGKLSAQRVWKALTFRAKMSSFVHRDGFIYGLDDGMLACVDARDSTRKWKEGRYGHGQLLLVGDLLLLTAESGEIFLLAPAPDGPHELAHFRVFHSKTWNPPALSGDLLLVRTDQEAACLRLPLARKP